MPLELQADGVALEVVEVCDPPVMARLEIFVRKENVVCQYDIYPFSQGYCLLGILELALGITNDQGYELVPQQTSFLEDPLLRII